jgi:hypothetical protein
MFIPKSSINSNIPELAEAKLSPGESGWTNVATGLKSKVHTQY